MRLTFPIRSDKLEMSVLARDHLVHRRTEFQTIDIYDTDVFGRVLLLDGHVQLAEFDEAAYHESLVHIPLLSIANPRAALVVGGGDGGALRELVKIDSLERIDMVEIDGDVVEVCREHLPMISAGAFDDPRVHLHIADAFPFVKASQDRYDLIILDSTDVYEETSGSLSEQLFTEAFYRDCRRLLSPRGMVVTQADNPIFCPYSLAEIGKSFASVFPTWGSYTALVPSFGGMSEFVWGSVGGRLAPDFRSPGFELVYLDAATYAFSRALVSFHRQG